MTNKLPASGLSTSDYVRTEYVATPDVGTDYETVLKPLFWAHVANRLRQWDEIEVRAADGTWLAKLVVIDRGPQWAKVAELHFYNFERKLEVDPVATSAAASEYELKWAGPVAKWRVTRLVDKAVMTDGHVDKADAARFLDKLVTQVA